MISNVLIFPLFNWSFVVQQLHKLYFWLWLKYYPNNVIYPLLALLLLSSAPLRRSRQFSYDKMDTRSMNRYSILPYCQSQLRHLKQFWFNSNPDKWWLKNKLILQCYIISTMQLLGINPNKEYGWKIKLTNTLLHLKTRYKK